MFFNLIIYIIIRVKLKIAPYIFWSNVSKKPQFSDIFINRKHYFIFTMINLLNIFKKSKEIPTVEAVSKEETEDISEMQRQKAYLSLEARRENHEILKIERERKKIERQIELESARADLQSLKEELYGEDETEDENNDKEMLILKMVNKFLNPQTPLNPLTPTNNFPIEKEGALIDDITLNKIKDKLPKEIKDYLINIDVGSLLKLKKNIELET